MNGRTGTLILVSAAACALYGLPALAETDAFRTGAAYAPLAEADMADLRGMAAPSSKVFVQTNDNNTPNNYSQVQNGQPSSASVVVATPTTAVIGTASVGNTNTSKQITSITPPSWYPPGYPTPPFTRPVALSYSVKPPAPFTVNVPH
jgi:hypothetical protein